MLRSLSLATLALASTAFLCAETDDYVRKSVPVQTSNRLDLDVDFGSINVEAGSSATVELEAYFVGNPPSQAEFDRMRNDFYFDVTREGSTMRVKGTFHDGWKSAGVTGYFDHRMCRNGQCLEYSRWLRRIEFHIKVPPSFGASLHTTGGSIQVGDLKGAVTARTSGGSLNFGRIDGPVDGDTSGGSITLAGGKGRATLHTSGGAIRIEDVAGDVDCSTSGGSIEIARTSGRVSAHTSGGSIRIGQAANAVDASTSGGGISVAMPANAGFEVDASTSGGGVSSDFTILGDVSRSNRQSLRGAVNGGGPVLRLRTSGGGIHIRRAS
jgi:Putative adhesin